MFPVEDLFIQNHVTVICSMGCVKHEHIRKAYAFGRGHRPFLVSEGVTIDVKATRFEAVVFKLEPNSVKKSIQIRPRNPKAIGMIRINLHVAVEEKADRWNYFIKTAANCFVHLG
ncbi:hypothetical protein NPIL_239271 [Nephila pilipes]|uniref:Uncharacterized protein n=1 Tax=Nephila pilipes TaxID=299642 RepID=A0A8X6TE48_NEPPI|nr:hypothetical protein NPIL_239271 [Nephila pilipes]